MEDYGKTTTEIQRGIERDVRRTPEINITNHDYPVDITGTIHLEQEFVTRPNGDDAKDPIAVVLEQPGKEPCNLFLLEPFQAFCLGNQLQTPAQLKDLRTVMTAIADYFQKSSEPKSPYEKAIEITMAANELMDRG